MTTQLSTAIDRLRNAWIEAGCGIRPGVTDDDIARFASVHDVGLPIDVAAYFRAVDGMHEGEHDMHVIRFWPLAEMKPALSELPEGDQGLASYFVFADYSLWAHAYAVRLGAGPSDVVLVGAEKPFALAPTFAEFLDVYIARPELLF